jgi:hypothetical protein
VDVEKSPNKLMEHLGVAEPATWRPGRAIAVAKTSFSSLRSRNAFQVGAGMVNGFYCALCVGLALALTPAQARADTEVDKDTTPVTQCEGLPPSVSIAVMSWSETTKICQQMVRVLEGVRRKDITNFEKAVYVLRHQGYEADNSGVATELVEIIRLRGLFDKPDRWFDTNDLIVRSWNAFNGAVGPRQVISLLRAAGPDAAKGLSDDGLTTMIILMKQQHQRGED